MKNLQITKARFLEWYFEDGEGTTEYDTLRLGLAEKIIERLKEGNTATITTEEIFNDCNQEAIRLYFCEGYEDTDKNDIELQDCGFKYKLELVDDVYVESNESTAVTTPTMVAKLVTATVVTRVIVDIDATDEEVLAEAKPRLLSNLNLDFEDQIEEIKEDLECPFEQYGDDDKLIDVYASVDKETWAEKEKEIMAFSIDDRNYFSGEQDVDITDVGVNIRIYESDFKAFVAYTTYCDTQEVEDQN